MPNNNNYIFWFSNTLLWFSLFWGSQVYALDVNITKKIAYIDTVHDGKVVRISRNQDQDNVLTGGFAKTSRKCPPYCIHPIKIADGVQTVGELEVLDFISNQVNNGLGMMIDARIESWYLKGTIPSSINIPFTVFSESNSKLVLSAALSKLGVRKKSTKSFITSIWESLQRIIKNNNSVKQSYWDFSEAKQILLWCNGAWCDQSPRAIANLIKLGYPTEKILYYRGGMQSWVMLGLTVILPEENDS